MNKHLFKVIVDFCIVIVIGLVLLVFMDSLKGDSKTQEAQPTGSVNQ